MPVILALSGCDAHYEAADKAATSTTTEARCDGVCADVAPIGYLGPVMVSLAANDATCPGSAPIKGFRGVGDLSVEPLGCPACSCGPATCELSPVASLAAATCGMGGASFSFDAPEGWEGTCSSGAKPMCGGAPCAALTVEPPSIQACAPHAEGRENRPAPKWGTVARECLITLSDTCETEGTICAPAPPEGFALCVYREGDSEGDCPPDYRHRQVVYQGAKDERECSPCSCGAPAGASCAEYFEVFKDAACGMPVASVTVIASEPAKCVDLPFGSALASKSAELVTDVPGSCEMAGGKAFGDVKPFGAVTLCCRADDLAP